MAINLAQLIAHLAALRASAAVIAAGIDSILEQIDAEAKRRPAGTCEHRRTHDVSTLGKRADLCLDCGFELPQEVPA